MGRDARPGRRAAALLEWMGAERSLLEGIKQLGPTNGFGALCQAAAHPADDVPPRDFQSLVWNRAATERIRLYGADRAVAGDLVTVDGEGAGAGRGRGGGADVGADAAGGHAADDAAADDGAHRRGARGPEAEAAAARTRRSRWCCRCPATSRRCRRTRLATSSARHSRSTARSRWVRSTTARRRFREGAYAAQFGAQFFGAQFAAILSARAPSLSATTAACSRGRRPSVGRCCGTATRRRRSRSPTSRASAASPSRRASNRPSARTALRHHVHAAVVDVRDDAFAQLTKQPTDVANQVRLGARRDGGARVAGGSVSDVSLTVLHGHENAARGISPPFSTAPAAASRSISWSACATRASLASCSLL